MRVCLCGCGGCRVSERAWEGNFSCLDMMALCSKHLRIYFLSILCFSCVYVRTMYVWMYDIYAYLAYVTRAADSFFAFLLTGWRLWFFRSCFDRCCYRIPVFLCTFVLPNTFGLLESISWVCHHQKIRQKILWMSVCGRFLRKDTQSGMKVGRLGAFICQERKNNQAARWCIWLYVLHHLGFSMIVFDYGRLYDCSMSKRINCTVCTCFQDGL